MNWLTRFGRRLRYGKLANALDSVVCILVSLPGGNVASGTGFVIAPGLICSARHVLRGAIDVTVVTSTGESYTVKKGDITASDDTDVAFIDIFGLDLPPLELFDSRDLAIRHKLYMASRAYDPRLKRSVLTLKDGRTTFTDTRDLSLEFYGMENITQRDGLALSSHYAEKGDSGAPLLTADGKVALMVTAYAESGQIGFPKSDRKLPMFQVTFNATINTIWQEAMLYGLVEAS